MSYGEDARGPSASVRAHGAKGDGVADDTAAIQACINGVQARGGGTVFFPRGRYRASGLTASGAISFLGEGGGDHIGGNNITTRGGSILTPAVAGQAVLTMPTSRRPSIRGIDFVHDRSFAADAIVLGPSGTMWPDLHVTISGFKGHALKIVGTLWEADLSCVHTRRCGDGGADKAVIEIDCTAPSSDGDTVRFLNPAVVFPQAVGFRMRSAARATSDVTPGFRRLVMSGGMFHGGLDEDDLTIYDADMMVVDGFSSLNIRDVNFAAVKAGRWALSLDGTLTTYGSSRAFIDGCQFNGPIRIGKCKDVTIGRNSWAFWADQPTITEHISITADATRTIIEDQDVVTGGVFVIADAGVATIKPTDQTVWLDAPRFAITVGSPTLGRAGARFPAWLLDAVAASEQVNASAWIPSGWRRFHVDTVWSNYAAGAGDVRWKLGYSAAGPGDLLTAGDVFFPERTDVAPAQDVAVTTTWTSTPIAVDPARRLYHFRISRVGTDATDTLPNDVALLGIRLRRAL